MTEKVQHHDFVELHYTGKLTNGTVFDTTESAVAEHHHFFSEKVAYKSVIICLGERQLLPGLDDQLIGKETNKKYTIKLTPEQAFGKRDVKKIKIVPSSTFKQHNVIPKPGLQIDVDGERGIITQVSGGRIVVNFNNPLAGREVEYDITITRKITDSKEKLTAYLSSMFRMPEAMLKIEITEHKAAVELPFELPMPLSTVLIKNLSELIGLKEIMFTKKKEETAEKTKAENKEEKK